MKKRHSSLAKRVHRIALVDYPLPLSLKKLISLAALLTDGPPLLCSQTIARSLQFGENLVENSC